MKKQLVLSESLIYHVLTLSNKMTTPIWEINILSFTLLKLIIIILFGIRQALTLRIPYVLRMIDESREKIKNRKYPSCYVMHSKNRILTRFLGEIMKECNF
jgi:hypothetical protein